MSNILSVDIDWVRNFTQMRDIVIKLTGMLNDRKFSTIQIDSTHDKIVKTIDLQKEPSYIVNIDHHHDLQYQSEEYNGRVSTGYKSCNWLGIEMCNKRITGCTWIANINSDHLKPLKPENDWEELGIGKDTDMVLDIKYDLNDIDNFEYNSMFLCQSPVYIQENWNAHGAWLAIEAVINTMHYQKILKKEGDIYYYES